MPACPGFRRGCQPLERRGPAEFKTASAKCCRPPPQPRICAGGSGRQSPRAQGPCARPAAAMQKFAGLGANTGLNIFGSFARHRPNRDQGWLIRGKRFHGRTGIYRSTGRPPCSAGAAGGGGGDRTGRHTAGVAERCRGGPAHAGRPAARAGHACRSAALKQVHETPAPTDTPQGPTFAGALENALSGVNASQHKAENIAAAYERGEVTDVAQVMLARQEASVSFEATLQVRNKLLSAYQDIMRMGV